MDKLTSRKFWVCVASAAIYAFCEAWVDSKAVGLKDEGEDDE